MQEQIQYLAALSFIDMKLDELEEEYGDLPQTIKTMGAKVSELKAIVIETEGILENVRQFTVNSKATLQQLKDKEEKLAKQQFSVRNNKEFDAITKEIEHIKQEHSRLIDELRTVHMKEENLLRMLEQQKHDYELAENELNETENELNIISSDQNEELRELQQQRKQILKHINDIYMINYNRIRTIHGDAVVKIMRNSCSGCFSQVPPQKIVEIRNNLDKIYHCENCGRIIYPEDMSFEEVLA